jgi:hypothetical protein
MILNQLLGIFGALLIAVGVFAPLVSVPLWGSINLFSVASGLALSLLGIAAAHLLVCIKRLWWGLWLTKSALLVTLGYALYLNWDRLFGKTTFVGNVLGSVVKTIVKVHWGVAALAGGILIVLAAALPRPRRDLPPDAKSAAPPVGQQASAPAERP